MANIPSTIPQALMASIDQATKKTGVNIASLIQQTSARYGVPAALLAAQIQHESGFNPAARGYNKDSKGHVTSTDRGIAQINDYWHPEITNQQADNPAFAIDWMANKMATDFKQTGSWQSALSKYNTGNPHDGLVNGYVNSVLSKIGSTAQEVASHIPNIFTQGQQPDTGKSTGFFTLPTAGGVPSQAAGSTPTTYRPAMAPNLISPLPRGAEQYQFNVPSSIKSPLPKPPKPGAQTGQGSQLSQLIQPPSNVPAPFDPSTIGQVNQTGGSQSGQIPTPQAHMTSAVLPFLTKQNA